MLPGLRRSGPLLLLGWPLLLSGCALVDQATFNPSLRPVAKAAAPAPLPPLNDDGALLSISLADGQPSYQDLLAEGVKQALAAKPDIMFEVISLVPQSGTAPPTWDQAQSVTVWGRRVADQIERDGVDQGQIALGLRATPGLDHGEIRVYVR
jgi:hypothetical protein